MRPGWQDMGGTFRVRARSHLTPDLESLFECEQLVLAPSTWAADALRLFDLELDAEVRGWEAAWAGGWRGYPKAAATSGAQHVH